MRRHAKAIVAVSAMLLTLALGVTFAGAVPPVLTIDAPSSVSYTSAHVSGTIDTEDEPAYYFFQYSVVGSGNWSYGTFQGPVPAGSGPESVSDDLTGLKAGTEYEVRLMADTDSFFDNPEFSPEPNPIFTTDPVDAPSVSIDPVTEVTADGGHFSGTINPNLSGSNPAELSDVDWHFECTPACPGAGSGTIAADAVSHVVSGDATGLDPNTDYEVRLVAENAGPPQVGQTTFKTSGTAPLVRTLPPAVISDNSAWIGGEVNPRNSATTYYIEYSSDPGFADSTSVPATKDKSAGSGNGFVFANHHAMGLQPDTTYYYRVVANGSGTIESASETFHTRSQPFASSQGLPDGRVYERVSPADKNGGEIYPGSTNGDGVTAKASVDGDAVAYGSQTTIVGESGGLISSYVSRRTSAGWKIQGLNIPIEVTPTTGAGNSVSWLSEDLSLAFTSTHGALNPGDYDPEGAESESNLYLHNTLTGGNSTVSNPSATSGNDVLMAVSQDGNHFVYQDYNTKDLWWWAAGEWRQVNVLPEETSPDAYVGSAVSISEVPGENAVSADGSRVFFRVDGFGGALYVRDFTSGGASTSLVSGSERTGDDPAESRQGDFELATADGAVAFFTGRNLTDGPDVEALPSLYRWEGDADIGSRLTNISPGGGSFGANVLGTVGGSKDGKTVYFVATADLVDGAKDGAANLYVWQEGEGLELVASLNEGGDAGVWYKRTSGGEERVFRQARVTPDGRFIAFASQETLTSYDTNGTRQIYLYDSEAKDLSCVSCSAAEPQSYGGAWFTSAPYAEPNGCCSANPIGYLPRSLSSDGSYIVFDSSDALVPEDGNGLLDVYQWKNGELRLISTGDSGSRSRLLDVSANGRDIFFTTSEPLVPSDPDTVRDLYDARVGGTAEPVVDPPCVGDECQGTPTPAPAFATPSSAGFSGQGNESPAKRRCRKGRVSRGSRCVPRKTKTHKGKSRRADKNGRAGR